MSLLGTVIPDDGLRVRGGAGIEHEILGALEKNEKVVLLEQAGDWWRCRSRFGIGFVHAAFITVETVGEAPIEKPAGASGEQSYTCVAGDTLSGIGTRFGVAFLEIAAINGLVEPFTLQIGQVLRIPVAGSGGGGAVAPSVATISLLHPFVFSGNTAVTSSSLQGHHTPWGGACSCDLDVQGLSSPGVTVHFNIAAPSGVELRGVVQDIGLACASQRLADGGHTVRLAIQKREAGGVWSGSGAWILYAHLDPVTVSPDEVVMPGGSIGAMGPASGGEYNSSCAQGSHVHMEASRARCVVNAGAVITGEAVMLLSA